MHSPGSRGALCSCMSVVGRDRYVGAEKPTNKIEFIDIFMSKWLTTNVCHSVCCLNNMFSRRFAKLTYILCGILFAFDALQHWNRRCSHAIVFIGALALLVTRNSNVTVDQLAKRSIKPAPAATVSAITRRECMNFNVTFQWTTEVFSARTLAATAYTFSFHIERISWKMMSAPNLSVNK